MGSNRRQVDSSAKRIASLTVELRNAENERARAEGQRDQLLRQLQTDFNLSSLEEATEKLEEWKSMEAELIEEREILLGELEEEVYGTKTKTIRRRDPEA